jgi:hypothetical protein
MNVRERERVEEKKKKEKIDGSWADSPSADWI